MEQFIGTKIVNAKPMNRLAYNQFRGWELPSDENGEDEGFLVEYIDGGAANTAEYAGYVSWSPSEVFKNAYKANGNLTFGDAIEYLKMGKRVTRSGWNEKKMYLWLKPATIVKEIWCKDPMLKDAIDKYGFTTCVDEKDPLPGNCGAIIALDTICMKTDDNKILTGWLASQTDMLSEDWMVF